MSLGPKAAALVASLVSGDPSVDRDDLSCLALNLYHEARGETLEGAALVAVASVTLNRADHRAWPDTVCDVVWQRRQFSWTHDGRSDRPKDWRAVQRSIMFAYDVLRGALLRNTDATHYYAHAKAKPAWAKALPFVMRIGNHTFHKRRRK